MEKFRNSLFTRIVPIVEDIGLWGDTIRNGYTEMGVIDYAKTDVQALQDEDENIARQFDCPPARHPARHRPRQERERRRRGGGITAASAPFSFAAGAFHSGGDAICVECADCGASRLETAPCRPHIS